MTTPEMGQTMAQTPEQLMSGWMAQTLCCVIRGIVACFPQMQLEKTMLLMAAVMGQQVSQVYAGNELSVHKYRKACREAFTNGINSVPITPLSDTKKADTASIAG